MNISCSFGAGICVDVLDRLIAYTKNGQFISCIYDRYGKLLPQDRERIGIFCKQLIDQGRIHYLEKHGYQAKMVAYVDKKYSLENIALLATAGNVLGLLTST